MPLRWICLLIAAMATASVCAGDGPRESALSQKPPERIGPPTYYIQDGDRAMQRAPDRYHMQFYPIPQQPITRGTYMQWLEDSGCLDFAADPRRGLDGPHELLPVLAKFVETRDRKWGDACLATLKDFHRGLREEVAKKGWTDRFVEEPAYLPLYRRYLIEAGLLDESRDTWFRDLFLCYARNLHVWSSPDTFWRGPCHRTQPEGIVRGLAAKWYADIPEAHLWRNYSQQVFQDFWDVKDLTENDTGYSMGPTFANMIAGPELRGNDEFITHPEMRKLWDRLTAEVTPDGAINPYGPNGGWNSTAPWRVWMLELAAAKTRDGRYRFAAHKLMNYLLYQREPIRRHRGSWVRETTQKIALAWLVTDDAVKPVQPDAGSQVLYRKQVIRIGDKEDAGHFLKDLDPAPDKAKACCYLLVLNETVPTKLVLRSGWNPGDLFALVDLFIGADPLNPGGILGLTRYGAPFTQAVSAKGASEENRIAIEDLSGKAMHRYRKNDHYVRGESWSKGGWKGGLSASAAVTVPVFEDLKPATFARVVTTDYLSLPAKSVREFAFIKNRLLLVRDVVEFEESFKARVAPVWNTQNVGPHVGMHWANTFFSAPRGGGSHENPLRTPPYDLLVYFAPQPGCRLQVVDRTAVDARAEPTPAQVRYVWEGDAKAGQKLGFTQVYWPHAPFPSRVKSNMAGARREWIGGELAATAGASGIAMLLDTPAATVARCSLDPDRVEWIACNPAGEKLSVAGFSTDAHFAYVDVSKGRVVAVGAVAATFLTVDNGEIFRQTQRHNWEK